jgi:hypothetical protein
MADAPARESTCEILMNLFVVKKLWDGAICVGLLNLALQAAIAASTGNASA